MNSSVGTPRVNSMSAVLSQRSAGLPRSLPRMSTKPNAKAISAPVSAARSVVSRPCPRKRHVVARAKKNQYFAANCPVTANWRSISASSAASATRLIAVNRRIRLRTLGPGGS